MSSPLSGLIKTDDLSIAERRIHESFMQRCLQLALLGAGHTAPNPMVGAVLVHDARVIGEGFHAAWGGPHAEVNCICSVRESDKHLIPSSTLYVSLEPCSHHGKTPPCADLILREKIPVVVVGCRDPFPEVNGKGIEKLIANRVSLIYPVLEEESKKINKRFFTFHQKLRPYVILKWAESANRKMAGKAGERIKISNEYANRLVHKWRSEEAGILIGTRTALKDDPELTTRLWKGKNPVRIVIDRHLKLPHTLKLFDGNVPTIILNEEKESRQGELIYKKLNLSLSRPADDFRATVEESNSEPSKVEFTNNLESVMALLGAIHQQKILSVLVEGGPKLLQSFIDAGIWDEIRTITNRELQIADGISSPDFDQADLIKTEILDADIISYYANSKLPK